jgi:hypothetical protein
MKVLNDINRIEGFPISTEVLTILNNQHEIYKSMLDALDIENDACVMLDANYSQGYALVYVRHTNNNSSAIVLATSTSNNLASLVNTQTRFGIVFNTVYENITQNIQTNPITWANAVKYIEAEISTDYGQDYKMISFQNAYGVLGVLYNGFGVVIKRDDRMMYIKLTDVNTGQITNDYIMTLYGVEFGNIVVFKGYAVTTYSQQSGYVDIRLEENRIHIDTSSLSEIPFQNYYVKVNATVVIPI